MVKEVSFDFCCEAINRYVLKVQGLNEILYFGIFELLDRLNYSRPQVSLLLNLSRNPRQLILSLPLLDFFSLDHFLPVLVCLFHDLQELFDLLLIIASFQVFLGLSV